MNENSLPQSKSENVSPPHSHLTSILMVAGGLLLILSTYILN
jgi:hypothetical protein